MSDRLEFRVLGRVLGTASGWDALGDNDYILYDYIPAEKIALQKGDLSVLFEQGLFTYNDDEGEVTFSADIIEILKEIPRV